ncbi:MAG: inorganic phosphate transporter [Candidatus Ratteibacteria bacterium]|nr:inorganic phosphate transporter [Candidatus Ratteibacteria bacterium]
MDIPLLLLFSGFLMGLYVAWNIGANDVANSMASAVGAKAITYKQAVVIASILTLVGATFIGSHVTDTIRKGIVDPAFIKDSGTAVIGFISALFAAGLWITFATWQSWPISTTHSIVGALIGFGFICGGKDAISWTKMGEIALSWVTSPILSGLMAFSIFKLLVKFVFKSKSRKKAATVMSPFIIIITISIIFFSLIFKTGLGSLLQGYKLIIAASVALLIILILWIWNSQLTKKAGKVESIFKRLQVMTSGYMALSNGANDVANAIGPVAAIYAILKTGEIGSKVSVPIWLLGFGGIGIALGISTWGHRVMETIGKKITKLSNTRGFTIDFSAATSILIASKLGMPVSTTHAVVGAVIGIGLARGLDALDLGLIKKILYSWLLTVPVTALLTIPVYFGLIKLFR